MLKIVPEAIDPRDVENAVRASGRGGVVTFLGIVRESSEDGRAVQGLTYEAYEALALAEFEAIEREVQQRFGDVALAIVHRAGEVNVGEVAVVVSAGSPHRAAAFDACEYAIDAVKARAAIWKKERYADGSAEWRANCPT